MKKIKTFETFLNESEELNTINIKLDNYTIDGISVPLNLDLKVTYAITDDRPNSNKKYTAKGFSSGEDVGYYMTIDRIDWDKNIYSSATNKKIQDHFFSGSRQSDYNLGGLIDEISNLKYK
jgi:hypothetical protein